ncbi:MAG: hypothetical protein CL678_01405 [Bdellovibrionaceae bacterium]|nr:hypothetical protein [Pseudobdellovibrionaceae bacterium]|tara:strand:- start:994 stop:2037 length:1044 start_codon:yes stop_codon:yes gene_type:complete
MPKTQFIFNGEEFSSLIFKEIDRAQKSIDISTYIFELDSFGLQVFKALQQKAQQGVRVRILADSLGSISLHWVLDDVPKGMEIRLYHTFYRTFPFQKDSLLEKITNWNHRNHQKLFIFDGEKSITGSRNIHKKAIQWHETSLIHFKEETKDLKKIFENLWSQEKLNVYQSKIFLSSHSPLLRKQRNLKLKNWITSAQKRITILTPYFSPSLSMRRRLKKLAKQGVKITLIVPRFSDVNLSRWINQSYYKSFIRSGISIYEYKEKILHSKLILIDDLLILGSSNFNQRSLRQDLEIDYITSDPEHLITIEKKLSEDIEHSVQIKDPKRLFFLKKIWVDFVETFFKRWT